MVLHIGQKKMFDGHFYGWDSYHWTYESAFRRKKALQNDGYYVRIEPAKAKRVQVFEVWRRAPRAGNQAYPSTKTFDDAVYRYVGTWNRAADGATPAQAWAAYNREIATGAPSSALLWEKPKNDNVVILWRKIASLTFKDPAVAAEMAKDAAERQERYEESEERRKEMLEDAEKRAYANFPQYRKITLPAQPTQQTKVSDKEIVTRVGRPAQERIVRVGDERSPSPSPTDLEKIFLKLRTPYSKTFVSENEEAKKREAERAGYGVHRVEGSLSGPLGFTIGPGGRYVKKKDKD